MAIFLFDILGATGHVKPTLRLAVILKEQGHEVFYTHTSRSIFSSYLAQNSIGTVLYPGDLRTCFPDLVLLDQVSRNDVELLFDRVKKEIVPYSKFDVILDYNSLNKNFYKGENGCRSFYGGVCSILQDEIIVLPDGKVTVCDQLYWNEKFIIGDLAKSSIEEVWNSDRVREILDQKQSLVKEASACKKCDIFDSCFAYRCWVDVIKAYGDDNMDYPDPRCIKAPPMINDISY